MFIWPRIFDLEQRSESTSPSQSSYFFHTWRKNSPCMRIFGRTFGSAIFWFCMSRRNWNKLHRDFSRLCSRVCSATSVSASRARMLSQVSYLADTSTNGRLVFLARRRAVVHFIFALDARSCKLCLLDGLLTLRAYHICSSVFRKGRPQSQQRRLYGCQYALRLAEVAAMACIYWGISACRTVRLPFHHQHPFFLVP